MGHIMQHVHPHTTLFIQHLWIESFMRVSTVLGPGYARPSWSLLSKKEADHQ